MRQFQDTLEDLVLWTPEVSSPWRQDFLHEDSSKLGYPCHLWWQTKSSIRNQTSHVLWIITLRLCQEKFQSLIWEIFLLPRAIFSIAPITGKTARRLLVVMQSPYCRLTVHWANPCSKGQPAAEPVDSDPSTFQAPSCSCSWTYKNLKEANISNHPWDLIVGILYIHEVKKAM